ncbi:MAG: Clp1/GlmU family protein [Nitrososphaerales archaeon]
MNLEDVLLVSGPALVKPLSEDIMLLGVNINSPIIVRRNKVLPFEALKDCKVEIHLGEDSWYKVERGNLGVKIWSNLTKELNKKIIIIGPNDSGKSTLSSYLSNLAYQRGLKVGIVDGDLGQNDLSPPCCLGSALINRIIYDLRDVRANVIKFIGTNSPHKVTNLVIDKMVELIEELKNVNTLIINTDGYLSKEGTLYKIKLCEELKVDKIIIIGEEEELINPFKKFGDKVLVAKRPSLIAKDRNMRIQRRMNQYFRFLKDSRRVNLNLRDLKVYFFGETYKGNVEKDGIMEKVNGGRVSFIYHMDNFIYKEASNYTFTTYSLKDMFVGLGYEREVKGFGLIERISKNFDLTLLASKVDFDTLFLSVIKLKNMREEQLIPIIESR